MSMKQLADLNILNESRSIKVEKYMLYKKKHDLLQRKDTESVHLQQDRIHGQSVVAAGGQGQ